MNDQLLSVILPVHNGTQWLGETLKLILAQTYSNFEIILVDDASTDNLADVLVDYCDKRLHAVHLMKNIGVSAARNVGIEMAQGSYIAFCDADDLCQPQRFELQLAFLEQHPEIGLCGSSFTCFDTQDRETVVHPAADSEIRKVLMQRNCFGLSTIMARARILKANRFDESLSVSEDYELWTRLAASGVRLANLPESLIRYRLHSQQASRHKSTTLDQVTRKIRSVYCAGFLDDPQLLERLRVGSIGLDDLESAAQKIIKQAVYAPRDFRYMLAWMYQQLPQHGIYQWRRWSSVQKKLQLKLDSNYRLNIALLAILPGHIGRKYFDTLIKIKR